MYIRPGKKKSPAEKAAKTRRRKANLAFRQSQPCGVPVIAESCIEWTKDHRMVCNDTDSGKALYRLIVQFMWIRDSGKCCICGEPVELDEATFQHSDLRSGGRRNDMPEYWKITGEFVKNGAAHGRCNGELGSVRQ